MDQKCTVVSIFSKPWNFAECILGGGGNLHILFNTFLMLDRFPSSHIESKYFSRSVTFRGC